MSTRDHNPISRYLNRPTRKNANNAMCARCVGCSIDHLEPGYRQDIKNCSVNDCPMHKQRPFQQGPKQPLEHARIDKSIDIIRSIPLSAESPNKHSLMPKKALKKNATKLYGQSDQINSSGRVS